MQIIEVAIDRLKDYENNPRNNEKAVGAVAESIKEFGFKVPIVIDSNYTIVAGHTRKKASELLGLEKVPCIIANDLTPEKIKAYRLADNKTAELAEWDFEKLEKEMAELTAFDFDMSAFGFDESLFDIEAQAEEDNFDTEQALEEIEEPTTQRGDIWQLGTHRLICGDSTDLNTIKRLMNGNKADLLLTDPPYNVAYEGGTGLTIQNDNMSNTQFYEFLKASFSSANENLKEGGAFYIWHADSEGLNFRSASEHVGWKIKQCLVWVKNTFVMGRQDYQWKHEPCLYGWKSGASHYFINDRTQSTVIEDKIDINKLKKEEMKDLIKELIQDNTPTTVIHEDKPLRNADHPTMKPIKLMSKLITNSSKKKEKVLDIFGGSGSTLIACEQLERQCFMAELDEKYCDVIIKRWETLTGQKAVKVS